MFMPSLPIGSSGPQSSDSGFRFRQKLLFVSQMPEKSGLPSAVRGAGADKLGFPSAALGTPAVGYFNHCADAAPGRIDATNATDRNAGRGMDLCMHGRHSELLFYDFG